MQALVYTHIHIWMHTPQSLKQILKDVDKKEDAEVAKVYNLVYIKLRVNQSLKCTVSGIITKGCKSLPSNLVYIFYTCAHTQEPTKDIMRKPPLCL